jgi:dihydrofolate synthase/folylpolyglutamate synthase
VNYEEAIAWLYTTQLHGIKLGLDPIERLTRKLAIRTTGTNGPKFIHVAGTNGKGSVCAFVDSILRAAGKRVGLYTSPHLVNFRERIRVNGIMISEDAVAAILTEIRDATSDWEHTPTFFEIATALALAHFQREGVDVAVLETGMGGRLDATNVVTPLVSVITPIYFDHQQWLGETLPEIALEKAGIIKPGVPVVCAWQREEVLKVIGHIALHRDAPFHVVMTPLARLEIGLLGKYQRANAALAVHAVNIAYPDVSEQAIADGVRTVEWPGRFQEIEDGVILDGAHNPAASRRLVETWREVFREKPASIVLGLVQDKDLAGIWEALQPIAARVFVVPVRSPRSCNPANLGQLIRKSSPEMSCTPCESLVEALALARCNEDPILVTGSLFLVGEALALLQQKPEPAATSQ